MTKFKPAEATLNSHPIKNWAEALGWVTIFVKWVNPKLVKNDPKTSSKENY